MTSAGVAATPFPISLTRLSAVPGHVLLLGKSVLVLFNGTYGSGGLLPGRVWYDLCSVACVVLAGFAAMEVWFLLRRAPVAAGAVVKAARDASAGAPGSDRPSGWSAARSVHSTYWLLSICTLTAVFVFSTVPFDIQGKRYLVTIAYAIVVLAATRAGLTHKLAVTGATIGAIGLVAAVSIGLLMTGQVQAWYDAYPTPSMADKLESYARHTHASVVYAGYWDAMPLGWFGGGDLPVYPISPCGDTLCRYGWGINTWYDGLPGARSLVVLDGTPPPVALGRARLIGHLGPTREVYAYGYDIGSRLPVWPGG